MVSSRRKARKSKDILSFFLVFLFISLICIQNARRFYFDRWGLDRRRLGSRSITFEDQLCQLGS